MLDKTLSDVSKKLAKRNEKSDTLNSSGLKKQVEELIFNLRLAMYPNIFGSSGSAYENEEIIQISLRHAAVLLREILNAVMTTNGKVSEIVPEIIEEYLQSLDEICEYLETDVKAAYEGDPAAVSEYEIILAYPAFEAISIYRLAHKLYEQKVPILPRMMTEYAHRMTGIDIHPGAAIGKYFFIDHGTGVVIGETTTIKDHVKLYQGVTLGAKSFKLDASGNPVKGVKRHPDIGSGVIIYAGATILGGNTCVGDGSIIGANVWLTDSVPAGSKVYYTPDPKNTTVKGGI